MPPRQNGISRPNQKPDIQEEVIRRLVEGLAPEEIILFGSRAWGKPALDSDMDLLVIVGHSDLTAHQRGVQALRCLRGLRVATDILVKTRHEFESFRQIPASLEHKIATQGKILYEYGQTTAHPKLAR
ncbi:MAG: Nucleotidyltransferase domain-containing protein [Candidatus Kentron sp. G]|nr:MAG: Nucleotidyltransferase domain-containing protein [Candidatus Kentron sp. G]VFM96960.1 MAG: Nucleotidyltransferase domain-containing protein [Candidatus Kentron sp. G]VFM99503.1 MAG: Nucleotidyltransferase domain-containing protein [Candidatus Kentron sp. G]